MDRQSAPRHSGTEDWHPADIKAALEKRGWSLRALAIHHSLTHSSIGHALRRRYPASERRIAEAIGVEPKVIWPSRYTEDGKPNAQRGNPQFRRASQTQRSTRARERHGKSRGTI